METTLEKLKLEIESSLITKNGHRVFNDNLRAGILNHIDESNTLVITVIQSLNLCTASIWDWRKSFKKRNIDYKELLTVSNKEQIVQSILKGGLTLEEVSIDSKVPQSLILEWMKEYTSTTKKNLEIPKLTKSYQELPEGKALKEHILKYALPINKQATPTVTNSRESSLLEEIKSLKSTLEVKEQELKDILYNQFLERQGN